MSLVYRVELNDQLYMQDPQAGDDAATARFYSIEEVQSFTEDRFFGDHFEIVKDALKDFNKRVCPKLAADAIVIKEDKILLVTRGINSLMLILHSLSLHREWFYSIIIKRSDLIPYSYSLKI